MFIDYEFVPIFKSSESKHKSDIISYAGKLLEIMGVPTVIVSLTSEGKPFVLECDANIRDALDFEYEEE